MEALQTTLSRQSDGVPVARHLVFFLQDGTCVVQWDQAQVQDLLTGDLLPFEDRFYGHAISDHELEQFQAAGHILGYDRSSVWLPALPEGGRFARFTTREQSSGRIRRYYLTTTLPADALEIVRQQLHQPGLAGRYIPVVQGEVVALLNRNGAPFDRLADAEIALSHLLQSAPRLLADTAVAFIDSSAHPDSSDANPDISMLPEADLEDGSQIGQNAGANRVIVCADRDEHFLAEVANLAEELGATFLGARSSREALMLIEDHIPDLVIMDLVMPDGHAWELLGRMRANQTLATIPVIIVSGFDEQSSQVFALAVAKAHDYLVKPVAVGDLRRSIRTALTRHPDSPTAS